MYGNPTTKELEKKYSTRPVGGAEAGRWGGEDARQGGSWQNGGQGSGWWTRWSHICVQINREEPLGSKTDHGTQGSCVGT